MKHHHHQYKMPTEIKSTGITDSKGNFTTPNTLDTAILQFTARVLSTPTSRNYRWSWSSLISSYTETEDPPADSRNSRPFYLRLHILLTRNKRFRPSTAFKVGVLSNATHGRVDGKGGLRAPKPKDVCSPYNLKDRYTMFASIVSYLLSSFTVTVQIRTFEDPI